MKKQELNSQIIDYLNLSLQQKIKTKPKLRKTKKKIQDKELPH